jgi:hypothetical protein
MRRFWWGRRKGFQVRKGGVAVSVRVAKGGANCAVVTAETLR